MNIIFGTDGWRGLLDKEINEYSVAIVARAFSIYIKTKCESPSVAIGYDGRRNSRKFAWIFAGVLKGNDIEVHLSDEIIPTPVLSYYVKNENLCGGVMITASHNPPEYNGIKFKGSYGGPFFTEETRKIEELTGKEQVYKTHVPRNVISLSDKYLAALEEKIDFKTISGAGLNILVDSMGGAGGKMLENILRKNGVLCDTIYGTPAEDFEGRYPEPIEKNLFPLIEKLKSDKKYSVGLATDGDADRLGVASGNGEWVSAQETILLIADYLLNHKGIEGNLVKTSSVTGKLEKLLGNRNRKVFDVQVGFKYICETMLKEDIAFGCEESGGYGYKDHIPERDGIYSALLLIEMIASYGFKNIDDLIDQKRKEFGEIFYDRIDYKYERDDRLTKLPSLFNSPPSEISGSKVTGIEKYYSSRGIINGLKFILSGESKWLLLRASETEPLVRIYAEAESYSETESLLREGKRLINEY